MKVKKSVVFAAALACGILLAVPLGAAAASNYRMAENGPATREESARLNRTFLGSLCQCCSSPSRHSSRKRRVPYRHTHW